MEEEELPDEKQVICRKLNVRLGPDTSFEKAAQLSRGQTVKVLGCGCGGWFKIELDGDYAWICSKYVD